MPVNVLLIEDNVSEARLIKELAADRGIPVKVTIANNCNHALAILSDGRFTPRLVIADMGALEFRGVELMKTCKPHGIPVVIFSGSQNPLHEAEALYLGANEFVSKPSTLDEYGDAVWKIISKWAAPGEHS